MEHLTRISPVPPSLAMRFGGASSLYRRGVLHQCRIGQAVAYLDGNEPVALAMLDARRARRVELAIMFRPAARRHMGQLIRETQLTLAKIAQARILVFARIAPWNARGARMARLAGFRPGNFRDPAIWLWKGTKDDSPVRRRWEQRGAAPGGAIAPATAGGERPPAGGAEPKRKPCRPDAA